MVGFTGEFCENSVDESLKQEVRSSDLESSPVPVVMNQMFYCEYQYSKCQNGVTVVHSKRPICGITE
jgi:antirestriction protein